MKIVLSLIQKLRCIFLYMIYKLGLLHTIDLKKMNYKNVLDIKKLFGAAQYKAIIKKIFEINVKTLRKHNKIKVNFIVFMDTTWSCDLLYQYFKADKRFDPCVVLIPNANIGNEYARIAKYYNDRKYNFISYKRKNFRETIFMNYRTKSDIVIHTSPNLFSQIDDFTYMPLNILNMLIPYSFWMDKYDDVLFTAPLSQICWKYFCPTFLHKKEGERLCSIGKYNMIYTGYPKMDIFYDIKKVSNESEVWKITNKCKNPVKIVYAPGMMSTESVADYSTFYQNYLQIFEYAKNHSDSTTWIYRPHPVIGKASVECKIFNSINEYNAYEKLWDGLPNARVSKGGDYYNIFKSSDGMITDSISFLSGYQYVHKPLLRLDNGNLRGNIYGHILIKQLYTAKGGDKQAIENFIENVLIKNEDSMVEIRKLFFEKYLDYKTYNKGLLASEVIFKNITESIF